ncbi:MAG: hypothetical protein HS115_10050 [Spirochaetales bacterium]|nr:hypothetical protein [Spirochaetales bacterium]
MAVKNHFELSILDSAFRTRLLEVFEEVERGVGREGLAFALSTVILELIGNAVKANQKRAFFVKNGYSLTEMSSYEEGLIAFKGEYATLSRDYEEALRELDLKVCVDIDYDNDRLITLVENNTVLFPAEETRIRQKLGTAMNSTELADFYANYGDDTEGQGLGLAMIVFLIRESGFNPSNFRVFRKESRTIARVEFPLNQNYIPIRERHLHSL